MSDPESVDHALPLSPARQRYLAVRRRTFELLEVGAPDDAQSLLVDRIIIFLIAVNVGGLIVGSVASVEARFGLWLTALERTSMVLFSAEYVLRIWSAPAAEGYPGAVRGRFRYARSPLAVIDLLAVLPFWLPMLGIDLRALRIARLLRVFRLAKFARYWDAARMFGRVLARKQAELVVGLSLGGALLVIASSLIYFAEAEAQPDQFSSIPAAMWWGIVTLSTVGYGDIYPITPMGRMLAAVVAILGVGMFALPAGILGAAFAEEVQNARADARHRCPHCNEPLP